MTESVGLLKTYRTEDGPMTERTDEEKGTEPETTGEWVRDLEGQSDTPNPSEVPATSEAGRGAADQARETTEPEVDRLPG